MTQSNNSPQIPIREFVGAKQLNLFQTLKQPQFTGELVINSSRNEEWTFYFYLGRILYATGGKHPVRRWLRNVKYITPNVIDQFSLVDPILLQKKQFQQYWEYELLNYWLIKGIVTREHLGKIIPNIIVEVLFDITQRMEIVFQLSEKRSLSTQLVFVNPEQVITQASNNWDRWQKAQLADRFPNHCPIILQSEQLKKQTSNQAYQIMTKLFNGKNTLRDLSLQLKQNTTSVTKSMLPYIQMGLIDLIAIRDLPIPLKFTK